MSTDGSGGARPVDPADYRKLIGLFATGVGIVTATHGGRRFAMTANSITSASTDPLLVLVSFMRDSDTGEAVHRSARFGLSVLEAERGESIARKCAAKLDPSDLGDQLTGIPTHEGPGGIPLIAGALECLACVVEQTHAVGDHDVVIARAERVVEPEAPEAEPLVFYDGSFWRLDERAS